MTKQSPPSPTAATAAAATRASSLARPVMNRGPAVRRACGRARPARDCRRTRPPPPCAPPGSCSVLTLPASSEGSSYLIAAERQLKVPPSARSLRRAPVERARGRGRRAAHSRLRAMAHAPGGARGPRLGKGGAGGGWRPMVAAAAAAGGCAAAAAAAAAAASARRPPRARASAAGGRAAAAGASGGHVRASGAPRLRRRIAS